jgi:hypothetical protein
MHGVSDLPNLSNRGMRDGDSLSATRVPRIRIRFDETKVLSERKNFEWAGS